MRIFLYIFGRYNSEYRLGTFVFTLKFAGTLDELDRYEYFEYGALGYNCFARVFLAGDAVPVGSHTD